MKEAIVKPKHVPRVSSRKFATTSQSFAFVQKAMKEAIVKPKYVGIVVLTGCVIRQPNCVNAIRVGKESHAPPKHAHLVLEIAFATN
jgi:hypothetical protein